MARLFLEPSMKKIISNVSTHEIREMLFIIQIQIFLLHKFYLLHSSLDPTNRSFILEKLMNEIIH